MSKEPKFVVATESLSHWYGKGSLRQQVLTDVTLSVRPGEVVFLTGPSGCGKTTLLTLVGALRSVMAGSLCLLGHELNGASESALVKMRRKVGFIFQHHNLHGSLTVLENVMMGLEVQGRGRTVEATQRCEATLKALGIEDLGARYQSQISGGQRQRTGIARALVGDPSLILADEPTAALDGNTGRQTIRLLRKYADENGAAILMVTHDPRVHDLADRIVALDDGRLSEDLLPPSAIAAPTVISNQPGVNAYEDLSHQVEVLSRSELNGNCDAGEQSKRAGRFNARSS